MLKNLVPLALATSFFLAFNFSMASANYKPFVKNVWLGGATANKTAINKTSDSVIFTVEVISSTDVTSTDQAKVEFTDDSNPNQVSYAVTPQARFIQQSLTGGGNATQFSFTVTTANNNTATGNVGFTFRLDSASTGVNIVAPLTKPVSITVQNNEEEGVCGQCGLENILENQAACENCNGVWSGLNGCCYTETPIIIDTLGDGFSLTNAADGVGFDLNNNGIIEHISWTSANSDDAWLVLDRNNNGTIDNGSELFGNQTPQPLSPQKNGFLALAEFDKIINGGNNDGKLSEADAIFNRLRLWQDANHNGISEASELHPLTVFEIVSIDLDYKESRRKDNFGNWFRYRAKVQDAHGAKIGRWAWDVYLIRQ